MSLLLDRRLKRAKKQTEGRRYETVAQLAHAVGLSPSYFSRRYRQAFGVEQISVQGRSGRFGRAVPHIVVVAGGPRVA